MLPWHQYLMGVLLVLAGMNHFRKPKLYERIIPPYIPAPATVALLSGILEMALGFMIMNKNSQEIAGWGIIIMLLLLLPTHIHMLQNENAALKITKWLRMLQIPMEFAVMYWGVLDT